MSRLATTASDLEDFVTFLGLYYMSNDANIVHF